MEEDVSQAVANKLDLEICDLARERKRLLARVAERLLEMKRGRHFAVLGFASIAQYAAERLGFSARKTAELIELAERARSLPEVRRAFEQGEIHWTKLRSIARIATLATEPEWLARAASLNSRQLERAVEQARGGADAKVRVSFEFTTAEAASVEDAIRAICNERRGSLSREQAILELCRRALSGTEGSKGPRFETVLYRCEKCGEVVRDSGGCPVTARASEAGCAACDSVLVDAREPARIARTIPPAVRRYVLARDREQCVVPDCSSNDRVDVHQLDPRADGSDRNPALLATLCAAHHSSVHEGALRIEGHVPRLRFFRADGTEIAARTPASVSRESPLSDAALAVVGMLGTEPVTIDFLIERVNAPVGAVLRAVTQLELAGLARSIGGLVALAGP
jgi:hypothetical protein